MEILKALTFLCLVRSTSIFERAMSKLSCISGSDDSNQSDDSSQSDDKSVVFYISDDEFEDIESTRSSIEKPYSLKHKRLNLLDDDTGPDREILKKQKIPLLNSSISRKQKTLSSPEICEKQKIPLLNSSTLKKPRKSSSEIFKKQKIPSNLSISKKQKTLSSSEITKKKKTSSSPEISKMKKTSSNSENAPSIPEVSNNQKTSSNDENKIATKDASLDITMKLEDFIKLNLSFTIDENEVSSANEFMESILFKYADKIENLPERSFDTCLEDCQRYLRWIGRRKDFSDCRSEFNQLFLTLTLLRIKLLKQELIFLLDEEHTVEPGMFKENRISTAVLKINAPNFDVDATPWTLGEDEKKLYRTLGRLLKSLPFSYKGKYTFIIDKDLIRNLNSLLIGILNELSEKYPTMKTIRNISDNINTGIVLIYKILMLLNRNIKELKEADVEKRHLYKIGFK